MNYKHKSKDELIQEIEKYRNQLDEIERKAYSPKSSKKTSLIHKAGEESFINHYDAPLEWIKSLQPGHHLCCIYSTEEEHREVVTRFILDGFENNEKIFYVVDSHEAGDIRHYLRDEDIDPSDYEKSGQLTIMTRKDAYMKGGVFDPDAMIRLLESETDKAIKEGYFALRITGEMTWALRGLPGSERLIEYESKLNHFFPNNKCLAICQYDRKRFDPQILLDVLRTHPVAIIGSQAYENFYYVPPDAMLGPKKYEVEFNRWVKGLKQHREIQSNLIKERDRFLRFLNELPVGVYIVNKDYDIEYLNPAFEKEFGTRKGDKCYQYLYGEKQPCDWCDLNKILKGKSLHREWLSPLTGKTYEKHGIPISNLDGTVSKLEVFIDINENKTMLARIEHLNAVLRAVRNVNQLITRESDPDKLIDKAVEYLTESGYTHSWIVRLDDDGGVEHFSQSGFGEHFQSIENKLRNSQLPECGQKALSENMIIRLDDPLAECHDCPIVGTMPKNSAIVAPLKHREKIFGLLYVSLPEPRSNDPEELALVEELAGDLAFVMYNIELKNSEAQAQSALAESQRHLSTLMGNLPGIAYRCHFHKDWRMEFVSDGCKTLTGYSVEELVGEGALSFGDMIHRDDREMVWNAVKNGMGTKGYFEVEYRIITKDGQIKWVWDRGVEFSPVGIESRMLEGFMADITDRKLAEQKIIENEQFLYNILDNLPIGIAVNTVAPDVKFTYVNDNFLRMYRVTRQELEDPDAFWEAVYNDPVFREELKKRVREDCASGDLERMQWNDIPIRRDGEETTYISARNIPIKDNQLMMSTVWDVTERKNIEEQFLHSQKMEAIGTLAGGVAHDFNNILTGINGYTQFALGMFPEDSEVRPDLKEVENLTKRAADLTRQLLAFGRKQTLETVVFNVNDMIDSMTKMLSRVLGEHICLDIHPNAEAGYVRADRGQIEQVLMNLVLNARDAMPDGGKLTIESYNSKIEEGAPDPEVKPGFYVVLAVSDTGVGMDADIKARVFEPFFTTKEAGKGTGLGLPMAYGIVKQHGGKLWVYSELGKGSTFKVYLPVVEKPDTVPGTGAIRPKTAGTEMVLIVEDEESVRKIIERSLSMNGYKALSASSAAEAEKIFDEHAGRISLLLTDVIMPDMNGRELYNTLLGKQSDLKVLYMSGYTDNSIVHHGVLDEGVDFIQKPFTPERRDTVKCCV